MLKGVNKRIVEINKTDSIYFEKAVLYLRPNVSVLPESVSAKETERVLNGIIGPRRKKSKRYIILLFLATSLFIAAFMFVRSISLITAAFSVQKLIYSAK